MRSAAHSFPFLSPRRRRLILLVSSKRRHSGQASIGPLAAAITPLQMKGPSKGRRQTQLSPVLGWREGKSGGLTLSALGATLPAARIPAESRGCRPGTASQNAAAGGVAVRDLRARGSLGRPGRAGGRGVAPGSRSLGEGEDCQSKNKQTGPSPQNKTRHKPRKHREAKRPSHHLTSIHQR